MKGGVSPLPQLPPQRSRPLKAPARLGRRPDGPESIARMAEVGNIPADADLERMLTTDGPFKAKRAPLHRNTSRVSTRVMTDVSPYNRLNGVILDVADISKIPGKLNLKDLREWESAQGNDSRGASTVDPLIGIDKQQQYMTFPPPYSNSRDETRTYAELLDVYSMHEFIIRKGVTLRNTPEFASFKRRYIACWGNVELVIRKLEEFLKNYGIDLAYVDGKKVAGLATYQVDDLLSREEMLQCLANREEVEPLTSSVVQQYACGMSGQHLAAEKIQATWRMYFQRIAYRHLLVGTKAAIIIQRKWALYRSHRLTKRTIKIQRETRLLRWKKTMEDFTNNWPKIKEGRRLIIHLPSLSYPRFHAKHVPFYVAMQMGQLTRLADLRDPKVDVVLLAPFRPEQEVLDYYHNLLENSGIQNSRGRFTLLVPEDAKRLPEGLSLTRLVVLSSRLMKCLAALCKNRNAYVVPGVIGPEELSFAVELNLPMLSADPTIAQAFGTKSGCQRLLDLAEVNKPVGVHGLRNRQDLLSALATLMIEHRDITRWLVKLETESGGRGHAYFDVNRIRVLRGDDHSRKNYLGVLNELEEHAGKRARLVHTNSYPDWESYAAMFDVVGGCVEAVPNRIKSSLTANLFVEPTGAVNLHSVVEPMLAPAYTVMGCRFPLQKFIPFTEVREAALSVGKAAFRRRIMGYMSVDFVFCDAGDGEESSQQLCAVDVDLYLTNNAAAHSFACLITDSEWDDETGLCYFRGTRQSLYYAYSGLIHSPFISAVRHSNFFSLCQSRGLSFDTERHVGLVFHMVDVLLRGCIGVLSVGKDRSYITRIMKEFQSLLNLELPKQSEHSSESNFVYFSSAIHQLVRSVSISKGM
ncbi:IQ calmodulin-binding protein motif family protein [Trypanosoma theileri]|uniref:IQ calmodulin-binding protein motif family protein n=1 Tax=Trypanosoma theileri TaxID=67003 RepID=A0A1X0NZG2_9TRYP|nr:IQ calmodulin-binding protein motif family protein [Trypanosoma theileri]ORC90065.1 IQ calmodulin-binding protein motif family protein [Trypanosoma theileri]